MAVDLNANHMALTRLKLAGIKHLPDYETFYKFFGLGRHRDNIANYRRYLRDHLDPLTRSFWESSDWPGRTIGPRRINYFKRGLYEHAKLGQFFRLVHGIARRMKRDPARLLAAKHPRRAGADLRRGLRAAVRQPARPLDGPAAGGRLQPRHPSQPACRDARGAGGGRRQAVRDVQGAGSAGWPAASRSTTTTSPGRPSAAATTTRAGGPCPITSSGRTTRRSSSLVDRVETHVASLTDQLRLEQPGSLNAFVLLDSQDWMPPPVIEELWSEIARVGLPGSRVIFRTAGEQSPVEQALSPETRAEFRYDEERARELHAQGPLGDLRHVPHLRAAGRRGMTGDSGAEAGRPSPPTRRPPWTGCTA